MCNSVESLRSRLSIFVTTKAVLLTQLETTLYSIINSTCTTGNYCLVASFEWSHFRILSTDSKVRITLYSIINSTTGKYCSVAFI